MLQIPLNCPHCGKANIACDAYSVVAFGDDHWNCFCICGGCGEPVIVRLYYHSTTGDSHGVLERPWYMLEMNGAKVCFILPEPRKVCSVDGLPIDVKTTFDKACTDYNEQRYEQACMLFRKTLEKTTKDMLKEKADGQNLNNRINMLAADGKLAGYLAEWAHTLRDAGNDFVHNSDPTSSDAADMETLTRMILMSVYTLPEMVEARKKAKAE